MSRHPFVDVVPYLDAAARYQGYGHAADALADVARFPNDAGAAVANSERIELRPDAGGIVVALFWPNKAEPYYFSHIGGQ